MAIFQKVFIRI